ncbi:4-(cytidine 5'-diphospho)-2-C-methyl-D-erythritol kinase [Alphaproteobacteria bacterium]|nr:4-(cytidine 5'-diphospho)-2-C-methyl-D-erythritol kinase [Alphaproteobacteria bacterium]MDB0014061.1 4-(cytidine 5'-diphospho)-2-C-methyl-D-erythritol kinase [Alphaproteobacteria bacterium]
MITIVAPAKINLFLRICGKTDDGYHLLDSAIVFTHFGDHLTIEPAHDDQLAIIGEFASGLANADDNLVMTALNGFRAAGGVIGGLSITLEKNIPVGAGLGGGSADAAAFLRAVNALSSMPLGKDALYHLAASLGADVPVCLAGGCQRIAGIGETMTPIDLDFAGAILLVNPRIPLSTKEVFTRFTNPISGFAGSVSNLDAAGMVGLGNDLTATAVELAPAINSCLDRLARSKGAIATAMSGSGASCFALFDLIDNAEIAARQFQNAGYWARASMFYQPD